MKKQLLLGLIAAVMLTSCGEANVPNVKDTEGVEKAPLSQLHEGYAEAAAKCEQLVMPTEITKQDIGEVYTFKVIYPAQDDPESLSRSYLKAFLGEDYDESALVKDSQFKKYTYEKDGTYAQFHNSTGDMHKGSLGAFEPNSIPVYLVDRDKDKILDRIFPGTELTAGKLAESFPEGIMSLIKAQIPDFDLEPYCIEAETYGIDNYAQLVWQFFYKGVPVRSFGGGGGAKYANAPKDPSPKIYDENGREMTEYTISWYMQNLFDKNCELVQFSNIGNIKVAESVKQEELIPLAEAVKLLDSELADNIQYEIDDVMLMYFGTQRQPVTGSAEDIGLEEYERMLSELDLEPKEFYPEWVFMGDHKDNGLAGAWFLRVNAVTGKITIDAPRGAEKQKTR